MKAVKEALLDALDIVEMEYKTPHTKEEFKTLESVEKRIVRILEKRFDYTVETKDQPASV